VTTPFRRRWPSWGAPPACGGVPPEALEQMREVTARFERIADLLDGDRVYLPFTVVHAHRVD